MAVYGNGSSSVRDIGAGFWAGFLWIFTGLWLLLCLANQAEAFGAVVLANCGCFREAKHGRIQSMLQFGAGRLGGGARGEVAKPPSGPTYDVLATDGSFRGAKYGQYH